MSTSERGANAATIAHIYEEFIVEFITRYRRPVFTLAGVLFAVVFMTGSSFGQVKAGIRPGAMAGPAVIMNGRNIPKPEPIRCPNRPVKNGAR